MSITRFGDLCFASLEVVPVSHKGIRLPRVGQQRVRYAALQIQHAHANRVHGLVLPGEHRLHLAALTFRILHSVRILQKEWRHPCRANPASICPPGP